MKTKILITEKIIIPKMRVVVQKVKNASVKVKLNTKVLSKQEFLEQ
jgi:hypothetical protein